MTYLEYSDERHAYYSDGRQLPSVTGILDRAGLISRFCKDDQAAWRGSSVHTLTADDDRGERLDFRKLPAELRGYVKAWRKYRADTGFEVYEIERRVDSPAGYAGRFDRLGSLPGQALPVILDIKTSKAGSVAAYAKYQLIGYAHALDPTKVFNRVAVALMPDGNYKCKIYPIADYNIDRAEWLAMVDKFKEKI